MISVPSKQGYPHAQYTIGPPISSTEKYAAGTASFQKTYRKVTLGHVPYLVGVLSLRQSCTRTLLSFN